MEYGFESWECELRNCRPISQEIGPGTAADGQVYRFTKPSPPAVPYRPCRCRGGWDRRLSKILRFLADCDLKFERFAITDEAEGHGLANFGFLL